MIWAGLNSAPYDSDVFGGSCVASSILYCFVARRLLLCIAAFVVRSNIHGLGESGLCLCCFILVMMAGISIHFWSVQFVLVMCSGKQWRLRFMDLPVVCGLFIGGLVGLGGRAMRGFCTDLRRSLYVSFLVVSRDAKV